MSTYRSREIAAATGISQRVIRFYVERRLLPPPNGRGTGLIYTDEHLLRLRAILRLRAERVSLDEIGRRLAALSHEELAAVGAPEPAPAPASPPQATATYPAERWERVVLVPGLELHVRADAGELLRRLAEEIHARYGVGAIAPGTS